MGKSNKYMNINEMFESIIKEGIKDIDRGELKRFVDYMNSFYGKRGVYSSGKDIKPNDILKALNNVFKRNKKYEWGGGDSVDREFTRDELFKMGVLSDDIYKKESVNESNGEFVVYVEKDNGRKKLLHTKKTQRAANMFMSKNMDKILNQSGVRSIGTMSKDQWEKKEERFAENIKKSGMKVITKKDWDRTHKDYKGMIKGQPYMMWFDKKTQSTVYGPVQIKESVNESSMEMKKLEDAIKMFQDKIKKQGNVTNARDEEHLSALIKIYNQMGGKKIKESVVNEAKVNYNFSEEELKRVLKLLGRNASTEVKMIKAFEKAFGRKLTRDELFESVNEGRVEKEVLQKISKFETLLGYITNDDQYKPLVSKVKKELDKLKKQIKKNESVNEAKFGYKDSTASYINKHNNEYKIAEKMNKGNEQKFYDELETLEGKIGRPKTMLFISNALRGYGVDVYKDPKIKTPADAQEALFLLSR